MAAMAACLAAVLALLLVPTAAAYEQTDAPRLDARIEKAWASEGVREGQQWQAFLQLKPGSNVTAVGYQACIVPGACIIAPRNATRVDERTWSMDTADYVSPITGEHYPWPAGKVGVKWFLADGNLSFHDGQALPKGLEPDDPQCKDDPAACLETHYLTLPVAADEGGKSAPAGPTVLLAVAVLALAGRMRRA